MIITINEDIMISIPGDIIINFLPINEINEINDITNNHSVLNLMGDAALYDSNITLNSNATLNIKGDVRIYRANIVLNSHAILNIMDHVTLCDTHISLNPNSLLKIANNAAQDALCIDFKTTSMVSFLYKESELILRTEENQEFSLKYGQLIEFAKLFHFMIEKFSCYGPTNFGLEDYHALRIYSKDKLKIKKFLQDNNNFDMDNLNFLDNYIVSNYFEISGICRSINDTSINLGAPIALLQGDFIREVVDYLGGIEIIDYSCR